MSKTSFNDLVNEITEFTGLNKEDVREKIWMEALNPGWNVKKDAIKFGINFHFYDQKMEDFYKQSYGFIYETSVEAYRNGKQNVLKVIESRIRNYITNKKEEGQKINLLMLGDGIGQDTSYFYNLFDNCEFFYFDVPGSKTYDFAMKRFQKYNIQVNLIKDYENIPFDFFDIIICLEVLEHLPNPQEAIKNIYKFLKTKGIVIITESFDNLGSNFPTHLKSNIKYSGKTPFIFKKYGLVLNFYSKEQFLIFRPTEYIKRKKNLKDNLNLYLDRHIIVPYLLNCVKNGFRG